MDTFRLEPGLLGESAEDQERAGAGEPAALCVEEELRAMARVEERAAAREIPAQGRDRLASDRHDALLRALADAADEPRVEVDARLVQPDRLTHAEPGAVEELDQRAVAQRARCRPRRGFDEALRLAGRQRARQRPSPARQLELGGGVVGTDAEERLVAEEGADRRDAAAIVAGASPAARSPARYCSSCSVVIAPDGPLEPCAQCGEIAPVGVDRLRRPLSREQREEAFDLRVVDGRHACRFRASHRIASYRRGRKTRV